MENENKAQLANLITLEADTSEVLDKCDLCTSSICCTYITQEISTPRSIYEFDTLLWQLYHQSVQFFREESIWYMKVLNTCQHLLTGGRCGIYENRPMICRDHENDFCEYDVSTEASASLFFARAEDLERYCEKRFKGWHKRYQKYANNLRGLF